MAIRTSVEPIDRDVLKIIAEDLSPAARSAALAQYAREELKEAKDRNGSVLGRIPPYRQFVDGAEGVREDRVKPDGVVVYEFELVSHLLIWIAEELKKRSPVGSGRDPHPGLYRSSHTLFADGLEIEVGKKTIPPADEFVFMNLVVYAPPIERGLSTQAPHGVLSVVADMAKKQFYNIARIEFSYRTALGGMIIGGRIGNKSETRFPAIVVKLGKR